MPPGNIVVSIAINHKVASVIPSVWVGVDDLYTVLVAYLSRPPIRVTLTESRCHFDLGLQDKVTFYSRELYVPFNVWYRFFDIRLPGCTVPPPGMARKLF